MLHPRLRFCLPLCLLLAACGPSAQRQAGTATPDTGPSIAEISAQAVASATQAALAQVQATQPQTPALPTAPQRQLPASDSTALGGLLLAGGDLPAGFQIQAAPTPVSFTLSAGGSSVAVDGWVASYSKLSSSGGREMLLLELLRFRGAPAGGFDLQAAFSTFLPSLNSSLAQAGLVASAAPAGFTVGEDSRGFALSTAGGQDRAGEGVLFRRGRVFGVVVLAGSPSAPAGDELAALARQQDAKLQAAPQ